MVKNYYLLASFGLALIVLIIGFSLYYINLADIENLLIIHYESLNGVDFLGSKKETLGILLSGLLINIINFVLASVLYSRRRFYAYLICITNFFLSMLILLTIIVIMSVN